MSGLESTKLRTYGPDAQYSGTQKDIVGAFSAWRIWGMLGWLDIKQRYRRAVIGPFWITLNLAIMVGALSVVYSTIFKIPLQEFIPYLTAGLIAWTFISSAVIDGSHIFINAESFIKHGNIPIAIHPLRMVWRNLIVLGHNLVVIIGVYIAFDIGFSANILALVPGLILVCWIMIGLGIMSGGLSSRYRDLPPIVASFMQVIFFITPILFKREMLGVKGAFIADYNPVFHLVEVIRNPLINQPVMVETWLFLLAWAVLQSIAVFFFYARVRQRLAYWI